MKRTALITGGTRGIGLGISKALSAEGYHLAINGVRKEEEVIGSLDSIRTLGSGEVIYCQGDVSLKKDRQTILEQCYSHFKIINFLVNNAGVAPTTRNDLLDISEDSYDRVMNTNLKGPFFLSQQVATKMISSKMKNPALNFGIVNISSISASVVSPERAQYCISKAGLSMMTSVFAVRLGEADIPVYEIRPGIILSDMTRPVKEKYDDKIDKGLCVQKRWGTPEDVGKVVAALARNELTYSTGQVIMVDGGLTIQRL